MYIVKPEHESRGKISVYIQIKGFDVKLGDLCKPHESEVLSKHLKGMKYFRQRKQPVHKL